MNESDIPPEFRDMIALNPHGRYWDEVAKKLEYRVRDYRDGREPQVFEGVASRDELRYGSDDE
jgi:hypothetical protein